MSGLGLASIASGAYQGQEDVRNRKRQEEADRISSENASIQQEANRHSLDASKRRDEIAEQARVATKDISQGLAALRLSKNPDLLFDAYNRHMDDGKNVVGYERTDNGFMVKTSDGNSSEVTEDELIAIGSSLADPSNFLAYQKELLKSDIKTRSLNQKSKVRIDELNAQHRLEIDQIREKGKQTRLSQDNRFRNDTSLTTHGANEDIRVNASKNADTLERIIADLDADLLLENAKHLNASDIEKLRQTGTLDSIKAKLDSEIEIAREKGKVSISVSDSDTNNKIRAAQEIDKLRHQQDIELEGVRQSGREALSNLESSNRIKEENNKNDNRKALEKIQHINESKRIVLKESGGNITEEGFQLQGGRKGENKAFNSIRGSLSASFGTLDPSGKITFSDENANKFQKSLAIAMRAWEKGLSLGDSALIGRQVVVGSMTESEARSLAEKQVPEAESIFDTERNEKVERVATLIMQRSTIAFDRANDLGILDGLTLEGTGSEISEPSSSIKGESSKPSEKVDSRPVSERVSDYL